MLASPEPSIVLNPEAPHTYLPTLQDMQREALNGALPLKQRRSTFDGLQHTAGRRL